VGAQVSMPVEPRLIADSDEEQETVRLAGSRCGDCGRVDFQARERCSRCGADAQPMGLSSEAALVRHTAVLHQPPGALVEVPYRVAVAAFPEGLSIMGLLVGEPESPEPGTRVRTVRAAVSDTAWTYAFQPVG
jgi:uncharacterized OB-fold protein